MSASLNKEPQSYKEGTFLATESLLNEKDEHITITYRFPDALKWLWQRFVSERAAGTFKPTRQGMEGLVGFLQTLPMSMILRGGFHSIDELNTELKEIEAVWAVRKHKAHPVWRQSLVEMGTAGIDLPWSCN